MLNLVYAMVVGTILGFSVLVHFTSSHPTTQGAATPTPTPYITVTPTPTPPEYDKY